MYFATVLLTIVFAIALLEDTHVKVYCNCGNEIIEEYDISLDLPGIFLILLIGLIPTINVLIFSIFIIFYIIHTLYNPKHTKKICHVFSLRGGNWITKKLLKIKIKILN